MSRGFSSANATAADSGHVRPVDFVYINFDGGAVRYHNAVGTIPWGGNDWLGAGGLLSIGPIEESTEQASTGFWVRLNGFDATVLNEALTQEIYKREVTVYTGFLNDAGALVDDPHDNMWEGYGDSMQIVYGPTNYILLECELEVARDHVASGAKFTDEYQQKRYSGDTGFEFLPQMKSARIHWGPGGRQLSFGTPVYNAERIAAQNAALRQAIIR